MLEKSAGGYEVVWSERGVPFERTPTGDAEATIFHLVADAARKRARTYAHRKHVEGADDAEVARAHERKLLEAASPGWGDRRSS